ncbi:hypothetical protein ABT099_35310, partial [Streptomyces prasinus]|uniref:hypothetical protein n=1 Tax=Streptomyces prasinus TaxID=67345 RepID=UPI003321022F
CFADTRASQVEIVQNIGRALRPNPNGTTKTARDLRGGPGWLRGWVEKARAAQATGSGLSG